MGIESTYLICAKVPISKELFVMINQISLSHVRCSIHIIRRRSKGFRSKLGG